MKVEIRVKGKKISRKKAIEEYGKERIKNRIQDAIDSYYNDPMELVSWMDGMTIKVIETE